MNVAAQHINLYHAALASRRDGWRAGPAGCMALGVVAVAALFGVGMDAWSRQREAQAERIETQVAAARLQLQQGPTSGDAARHRSAELDRLHSVQAGQARLHGLLSAQLATGSSGYTPYFLALSRQANAQLWITGFEVGADDAVTIEGRMVDAAALPVYLRRLNGEPQFRGRGFDQLTVKSADAASAPGVEFSLRSRPQAGAEAAK